MSGIERITAERQRQIEVEGWTPEHDDEHVPSALTAAACCYAYAAFDADPSNVPGDWPWSARWWKPSDDPIRNLVKAGALIAAEIDRLERAS